MAPESITTHDTDDVDSTVTAAGVAGLGSAGAAVTSIEAVERRARLVEVDYVDLIGDIDDACVCWDHGHRSAKEMVRHVAQCSNATALARERVRRLIADNPVIDGAWRAGELGVDQARLLAKAYANPRVRSDFEQAQGWFLKTAAKLSFKKFELKVADWVGLHDQDGPEPDDTTHAKRDAKLVQDHFSKAWHLDANGPSLPGAIQREIFDAYIEAEYALDWEHAKAIHGDDACTADLARSDAQRRYDALYQIFLDAAANPETSHGANIVHNFIWDAASFEEMAARLAGADPKPLDIDTYRCTTLDGHRIEPSEAVIDAFLNQVRRVIVDAKGVTIDLGQTRLFTGLARLAAKIRDTDCDWLSCAVPVTRCDIDHTEPHSRGGPTDQDNADNFCPRHNRLKEKGYTVYRRPDGTIAIITPNGETIQ